MWDERIEELVQFQQKHGHCEVPDDSDEYEDLSAWIRQIRSSYYASHGDDDDDDEKANDIELTEDRIDDLQNLGLELYLLRPVQRGKRRLKELIAYKRLHGHHWRGPSNSADFRKLSSWLKKLQTAHELRDKEEVPILMDVQLSQLQKIGYDFNEFNGLVDNKADTLRGTHEDRWNRRVEELKEFKGIHGHFQVPNEAKYASLYRWVRHTRCFLKKYLNGDKSRRITDDRIAQLRAIGFDLMNANQSNDFDRKADDGIWTIRIQELRRFIQKYGHYKVPSSGEYAPLCQWLQDTRSEYKKLKKGERSLLTKDHVRQFLEIEKLLKDSTHSSEENIRSPEATERGAASMPPQHHLDVKPIPTFINHLVDTVDSMLEKGNHHWERDYAKPCGGRPNQFWLEIGDRDGIDFFSSLST